MSQAFQPQNAVAHAVGRARKQIKQLRAIVQIGQPGVDIRAGHVIWTAPDSHDDLLVQRLPLEHD